MAQLEKRVMDAEMQIAELQQTIRTNAAAIKVLVIVRDCNVVE